MLTEQVKTARGMLKTLGLKQSDYRLKAEYNARRSDYNGKVYAEYTGRVFVSLMTTDTEPLVDELVDAGFQVYEYTNDQGEFKGVSVVYHPGWRGSLTRVNLDVEADENSPMGAFQHVRRAGQPPVPRVNRETARDVAAIGLKVESKVRCEDGTEAWVASVGLKGVTLRLADGTEFSRYAEGLVPV
jgi:hypothetical protein